MTEPDQIWVWSGHEASILKTYRSHSVIRHLKKKDHKTWLKKSDFSSESVIKMYKNFQNGMLDQYLLNQKDRCSNVPIREQEWLTI